MSKDIIEMPKVCRTKAGKFAPKMRNKRAKKGGSCHSDVTGKFVRAVGARAKGRRVT